MRMTDTLGQRASAVNKIFPSVWRQRHTRPSMLLRQFAATPAAICRHVLRQFAATLFT
jgi:hypothetical protein